MFKYILRLSFTPDSRLGRLSVVSMSMAISMTVVGRSEQGLLGVVVGHVGEHAVLDVATEDASL